MSVETLVDLFEQACSTYRKSEALLFKSDGRYQPISSMEFRERVTHFAAGLAKFGIQKGDRIALLSENRPEWAIADLGMLSIGAINVPFYPTLPAAQICELLNDSGSRMVIVSGELQLAKIASIRGRVPSLEKVILMDPGEAGATEAQTFLDLLELGKQHLHGNRPVMESLRRQVQADDVASIIYTSGTTGTPKGVMLTHRNIVTNVHDSAEAFDLSDFDVTLCFLPLCHIFQRTVDYLMMHLGVTIAYGEGFDSVPQNLQEVRPTVAASVPRFFEKLYARVNEAIKSSSPLKQRLMAWALTVGKEHSRFLLAKQSVPAMLKLRRVLADRLVFSKLRQKLGGRIRFFISGGAPLEKELADFFFSVGILILEGYGLTETSPVITVNRSRDFRFGTVGKVLRHVEVKIAEDGEILARGPSIMLGYYKREAETREALEGGWFHTGDIGNLDPEGFLKITDRKKDLIVTASGKNVAPQKIEGLLKTNSYFLNVVMIGNKRPFVSALVVPNPEKIQAQAKELGLDSASYPEVIQSPRMKQFLLDQIHASTPELAPFEQVKRIAILEKDFTIDAGELTPTMKVRRRFVESKYKDLIEKIYAS